MRVISIRKEQILIVLYIIVIVFGLFSVYRRETLATFSMPLSKKIVVLDAGHGGWDPGKVSQTEILEKDINLQIAKKVQSYLEQAGAIVIMTRVEDEALGDSKNKDLKDRKRLANDTNADLILSIHQNSYPSENVTGSQCFYFENSEESKKLAGKIQKEIKEFTGQKNNRLEKPDSSYYILKESKIPAVIIECGFLSSPKEAEMLVDDIYQEKMAWAIYKGIVEHYNSR